MLRFGTRVREVLPIRAPARFADTNCVNAAWLNGLLLFICTLLLAACGNRQGAREAVEIDPLWSTLISAHTVGPISRQSEIRVVFNQDVVSDDRIGKDASDQLKLDPKAKASVVFESKRELVVKPKEQFEAGKSYRIAVKAKGLQGTPAKLSDYVFNVQVQAPEYQVHIGALGSGPVAGSMQLNGEIATADSESAERVERILKAEYSNKPVELQWQHAADGRSHRFTAALVRGNAATPVNLAWDGAPIGASNKGERQVEVPARGDFLVTGVTLNSDSDERRIDVVFSDALATDQDLRGLVQLSQGSPRLRIEGNVLRIYVEESGAGSLEGQASVTLSAGIRNERGEAMKTASQHSVVFTSSKPQVRFVGNGVILPDADKLTVQIEAVNLRALRVAAFRVYENNLPQFLQVNNLDGGAELNRVGRTLWRKHVRLGASAEKQTHRWQRYSLDVTELMRKNPGAIIRLNVAFKRDDINFDCPGLVQKDGELEAPETDADSYNESAYSSWDYFQNDYNENVNWAERDNPCKPAYYYYSRNIKAQRNLLVSNIGLLAKRDQFGKFLVIATDLRSAQPLSGVQLTAFNFQNQSIQTLTTGGNGMVDFKPSTTPYLIVADKGGQKGYLKVAQGTALPVSHFDVGGEQVASGLKATLYGERGVWRPGDDLHLTLAVQDQAKSLPANHPVKLELFDPRAQLVSTTINDKPVGSLYAFTVHTNADAPTGEWTAKATLGGSTFSKTLKVETVMPNRLKMELELPEGVLNASAPIAGKLSAQWLTGAKGADLHADIAVRFNRGATKFSQFADFVFDDPTREVSNEPLTLFDGTLDNDGDAKFDSTLRFEQRSPGMLNASFTTRVFEPGGAFSVQRTSQMLSPYASYVGIKLPKGDVARSMLLTDVKHPVELASLSVDGKPVSLKNVELTIHKIHWRWWWDQSGDSLAQYASSSQAQLAAQGVVATRNGSGRWEFEIKYPEWGRYLIRACDTVGGHCASVPFYIDWPGWAGRPQDQSGPGANMLAITSDKTDYRVGETAKIDLPEGSQGRALLTIENGSRILDARWIDAGQQRRIEIPLTAAMAPNVYASITLIQAHSGKNNDRPLRLYGIVPLKVTNPETHLSPVVNVPVEWAPGSKAVVKVSESTGRAMSYTVAIVDEGLLGLTNFKTPNLHEYFYKREALGIATWDLFDQVAGAYQADLERLLALGGSDANAVDPDKNKSRFPPMVRFIGPFQLAAGKTAAHEVQLPKYVGAVRVMVVASTDAAYGSAEKSVFVRQPLMLLPTLPRVVGPSEEIAVPVSVFVMDDSIREVTVTMSTDSQFTVEGSRSATLQFKGSGEQLAILRVKSAARIGQGQLKFVAASGKHRADGEVFLNVRSPNVPTIEHETKMLQPGESWRTAFKAHGLLGTNEAALEVSAVPPLNFERRLEYLIHYPHGCLEQTTSAAFPQLYLPSLTRLSDVQKRNIEMNIAGGIERLRQFQQPHGGFTYWPTNDGGAVFDPRGAWSTTYVGHFLLEAERLGYHVPQQMHNGWLNYQRTAAQNWAPNKGNSAVDQAYRLYSLALANQPEMGAMNRLREYGNLPLTARWLLAASYKLAGANDAVQMLLQGESAAKAVQLPEYAHPDDTFGSRLRDQGIILHAMTTLGRQTDAQPLVSAISQQLNGDHWFSTHSLAYSMMAMSKFIGAEQRGMASYEQEFGGKTITQKFDTPIQRTMLGAIPESGVPIAVKNTSQRVLFVTAVSRGVPPPGDAPAESSGLSLQVEYLTPDGKAIDAAMLRSGTDLIARVTVRNVQPYEIKNLALTQMTPAGWEIMNDRLEGVQSALEREGDETRRLNDWYYALFTRARDKTEYLDIRDDRVQRYFSLQAGEHVSFVTRLNAAYLGRFWLPGVSVEAMYDAARNARTAGQWVSVTPRGEK